MLSRRQLQGFVRAPFDFKIQLAFGPPGTGRRGGRPQASSAEPDRILITNRRADYRYFQAVTTQAVKATQNAAVVTKAKRAA